MAKILADRSDQGPPDPTPLREAARQRPGDPEALRRLGWALYGAQAYSEAVDVFVEASRAFPGDEGILYGLGLASKHLGKTDAAVEAFGKVVALAAADDDPGRSEILHRLGTGHQNVIRTGNWGLKEEVWGGS